MERSPVRLVVVGAGNRGSAYARLAVEGGARIVAVADPNVVRRDRLADHAAIPVEHRFDDWRELLAAQVDADAVIIATPDRVHAEPAIAFATTGYHVLVEKPMSPDEAEAVAMADAAAQAGVRLVVAHVMRYQPYTQAIRQLIADGAVGDLVSVEHLEPIGEQHFAHSYVRGNWRNEQVASSMLMSKACHDLDWVAAIVDAPVRRVSSFGGLFEFRPERAPAGSAERCLDCDVESTCPFSAVRQYLGQAERDDWDWPVRVITDDRSVAGVTDALRNGPYGRCVYRCDNDVVDHQVVNLEFVTGATAAITVSAFAPMAHRKTRIGGTRGHIDGDGHRITVTTYLDGSTRTLEVGADGAHAGAGHGGGDLGLITAFLSALRDGDWASVPTDGTESLATHRIVWAAEQARRTATVVTLAG